MEGERERDLKREIQAVWFSLSLSSMSPLLKWSLNIVDSFAEVAVTSLLRVCGKNVDKLSVYVYILFYNVVSSFFFKRFFACFNIIFVLNIDILLCPIIFLYK